MSPQAPRLLGPRVSSARPSPETPRFLRPASLSLALFRALRASTGCLSPSRHISSSLVRSPGSVFSSLCVFQSLGAPPRASQSPGALVLRAQRSLQPARLPGLRLPGLSAPRACMSPRAQRPSGHSRVRAPQTSTYPSKSSSSLFCSRSQPYTRFPPARLATRLDLPL